MRFFFCYTIKILYSWSDYTGADSDKDGFGDFPYDIPGTGGNQDNPPLMKCPLLPKKKVILVSKKNKTILRSN